jgi:hypothetical protein
MAVFDEKKISNNNFLQFCHKKSLLASGSALDPCIQQQAGPDPDSAKYLDPDPVNRVRIRNTGAKYSLQKFKKRDDLC